MKIKLAVVLKIQKIIKKVKENYEMKKEGGKLWNEDQGVL